MTSLLATHNKELADNIQAHLREHIGYHFPDISFEVIHLSGLWVIAATSVLSPTEYLWLSHIAKAYQYGAEKI